MDAGATSEGAQEEQQGSRVLGGEAFSGSHCI